MIHSLAVSSRQASARRKRAGPRPNASVDASARIIIELTLIKS